MNTQIASMVEEHPEWLTGTYTTKQVARLTGATERQLQWWDEQGIISPARSRPRGPFTWRSWSAEEVRKVELLVRLRKAGISLQKCCGILRRYWKDGQRVTVIAAPQVIDGVLVIPAKRGGK